MSEVERFYVDIRVGGCVVRDRRADILNEDDPGLSHSDTPGVIKMWFYRLIPKTCPTCGHVTSTWADDEKELVEAKAMAKDLNRRLSE